MILLLPTKEYWFSKIHRRLEDIVNHSVFPTFYEITNTLVSELMHVETINDSDDINWFKRKSIMKRMFKLFWSKCIRSLSLVGESVLMTQGYNQR